MLLINTGSHPSGINITIYLKRPNPEEGGPPYPSLFGLSPDAVYSGGIFSVALALRPVFTLAPLGIAQHPALWSSDFPHKH